MIRVCDYIATRLHDYGVRFVYGITGGGAAGLNDGFAKHGGIRWVGNHHEQASAFAAMGQAKLTGKLAVVNPTTGCGGTNCITGVLDAWQDSVPVLFISGNVNRAQMTSYLNSGGRRVRKLGVQEADIIELVAPITKYAQTVDSPEEIVHKLEAAIWFATHGRRGPVWLDIPTDVQTALIEPADIPRFPWQEQTEAEQHERALQYGPALLATLKTSRRPLVLLGAGMREDAAAVEQFLIRSDLPFVCTYGTIDLFPSDHPLYVGRVGVKGDRAGNFALAHCDSLLVLGSSLSTPVTGYDLSQFAPLAKVTVVDIEEQRNTTFDRCDYLQTSVSALMNVASAHGWGAHPEWVSLCLSWRDKWPVFQSTDETAGINLYAFVDALSRALPERAVVVSDAGSAIYVPCQGLKLSGEQRHVISLAQADMGWSLPASIGVALEGRPTVVLTGDGSFQTNLQELATIRAFNLPVKIFVWNNSGYLSIRATQNKLFEGRLMGTDNEHGLWFPDLRRIADAYEMDYHHLDEASEASMMRQMKAVLAKDGPVIVEVFCPPDQLIIPTIGASRGEDGSIKARPLYDMAPYLPREEIQRERAAALSL